MKECFVEFKFKNGEAADVTVEVASTFNAVLSGWNRIEQLLPMFKMQKNDITEIYVNVMKDDEEKKPT